MSKAKAWASLVAALATALVIATLMSSRDKGRAAPETIAPTGKVGSPTPGSKELATSGKASNRHQSNPVSSPHPLNFTPDQFELVWESVMKIKAENSRISQLGVIVAHMAREGRAEEAIAKVRSVFGPGSTRSSLIGIAFSKSSDLAALSKLYGELEFDEEKVAARQGLGQNIGDRLSSGGSAFSFPELGIPLGKTEMGELVSLSAERYVMARFSKSRAHGEAAIDSVYSSNVSTEVQSGLISKFSAVAPFACWDEVQSRNLTIAPQTGYELASKMASADPLSALEKIAARKSEPSLLAAGLTTWLQKDSDEAIAWLQQNKASLSSDQLDRSYQVTAVFAAQHNEPATAKAWISEISDKKIRDEVSNFLFPKHVTNPAPKEPTR